jgi:acetyltransferase
MNDGTGVTIRPIRPEDEPLLVQFHQGLSDRSVLFRYFHSMNLSQRIAHERLIRVCFSDYARDLALVTEARNSTNGERFILGIGRLSKLPGSNDGEFAIVVSDAWQKRGLGRQLLERLVDVARKEKLDRLFGTILSENTEMRHLAEKLGFKLSEDLMDSTILASMELADCPAV